MPSQANLPKLRARVARDDCIHTDDPEDLGVDRFPANWLGPAEDIPAPPTCVFCNAPWTPEMIELVELSGYCETCADAESVIDVFCTACCRLVYRKEVR
jgi:hypothetical protein